MQLQDRVWALVAATEGGEMIGKVWAGAASVVLKANPHGTEERRIEITNGWQCQHWQVEDDGRVVRHGAIPPEEGVRWLCGHGG